jgi:hypothetical protein
MITVTVRKLLCGAVAVLAVAVLVPAALAADRPDDRAGPLGVAAAQTSAPTTIRPDDRAGPLGPGAAEASAVAYVPMPTADVIERRIEAGLDPITGMPVAGEPAATDGFEWSDPLVLAGFAALAAAAVLGVTYLVVHTHHGGTGTGRPAATH